jgi:hypothetical protein
VPNDFPTCAKEGKHMGNTSQGTQINNMGNNLHIFPYMGKGLDSIEKSLSFSKKEFTWTRGNKFEHSPIKIHSTHCKEGSSSTLPMVPSHSLTDIGALRGMKSLARENPCSFSPTTSEVLGPP